MARISAAPVHPNFYLRRPFLQNAPPQRRPRFSSFGPPQQRTNSKATAAAAGRDSQTGRAAPDAAAKPRPLRGDEERGMGRKGRKGNDGGLGGLSEETLVRVTTVLEEFRASDAQGLPRSLACFHIPLSRIRS